MDLLSIGEAGLTVEQLAAEHGVTVPSDSVNRAQRLV
jgi:hypothetical protein